MAGGLFRWPVHVGVFEFAASLQRHRRLPDLRGRVGVRKGGPSAWFLSIRGRARDSIDSFELRQN